MGLTTGTVQESTDRCKKTTGWALMDCPSFTIVKIYKGTCVVTVVGSGFEVKLVVIQNLMKPNRKIIMILRRQSQM